MKEMKEIIIICLFSFISTYGYYCTQNPSMNYEHPIDNIDNACYYLHVCCPQPCYGGGSTIGSRTAYCLWTYSNMLASVKTTTVESLIEKNRIMLALYRSQEMILQPVSQGFQIAISPYLVDDNTRPFHYTIFTNSSISCNDSRPKKLYIFKGTVPGTVSQSHDYLRIVEFSYEYDYFNLINDIIKSPRKVAENPPGRKFDSVWDIPIIPTSKIVVILHANVAVKPGMISSVLIDMI